LKKADRIENFVASLGTDDDEGFDPCYLGYFECFNRGLYYEAHDVLEHLWLKEGRGAPDYAFHKGLIQLAGGFVHLKLQRAHPEHPKHGRRLHPARRLFLLAVANLAPYGPRHLGINAAEVVALAERSARLIEEGNFRKNPWSPEEAPVMPFPSAGTLGFLPPA
jgi:hypothetical protein